MPFTWWVKAWLTACDTHVDVSEDVQGENEVEQSGKSENRNAKFLPVGKAHKAMLWPIPHL